MLRPPSRSRPRRARSATRNGGCVGVAVAVLLASVGRDVSAQTMMGPLVPRGHVRLDFASSFSGWHERYGLAGGVESVEPLGGDLTDPTGRTLFPGLATLEESLRALSGDGDFGANLGDVRGDVTQNLTRLDWGLRVGVFDWLTVGGVAPYVKGHTAVDLFFRPDADAALGLNPFRSGDPDAVAFLDGLGAAAAAASARAGTVCAGDPGPACTEAQALSARTADFADLAQVAYGASPFFPTAGSSVSTALMAAFAALDADLTAAGLAPVGAGLVFAENALDEEGLAGLPAQAGAGFQALALGNLDGLWTLGDIELSADVRLLHHDPAESGDAGGAAFTLSAGATVRLPTGTVDDPHVFLDLGSGDGQMDLEGRADGTFRFGRRLGLRASGAYGVQRARTLVRRVAPHERVFVRADLARGVRWTPGSYWRMEVSPRLRLSDDLAIAVDYRHFHKAADEYALVSTNAEGGDPDVSVLMDETEMTLRELGVGLRYSTRVSWALERTGTPVDLGARWVGATGGSGGRTPKASRFELSLSLYRRIWGER